MLVYVLSSKHPPKNGRLLIQKDGRSFPRRLGYCCNRIVIAPGRTMPSFSRCSAITAHSGPTEIAQRLPGFVGGPRRISELNSSHSNRRNPPQIYCRKNHVTLVMVFETKTKSLSLHKKTFCSI